MKCAYADLGDCEEGELCSSEMCPAHCAECCKGRCSGAADRAIDRADNARKQEREGS